MQVLDEKKRCVERRAVRAPVERVALNRLVFPGIALNATGLATGQIERLIARLPSGDVAQLFLSTDLTEVPG